VFIAVVALCLGTAYVFITYGLPAQQTPFKINVVRDGGNVTAFVNITGGLFDLSMNFTSDDPLVLIPPITAKNVTGNVSSGRIAAGEAGGNLLVQTINGRGDKSSHTLRYDPAASPRFDLRK
jgi:hypothetical protein